MTARAARGVLWRRERAGRAWVGAGAAAAVMAGSMALAQPPARGQADVARPPTPRLADNPPRVEMYTIAALLIVVVFAANLLPSKRGHQD